MSKEQLQANNLELGNNNVDLEEILQTISDSLINLAGDTVTADTLLVGVTAHDSNGNRITGTMPAGVELNLAEVFDKFQPVSTVFGTNSITSTDASGNSLVYLFDNENEVYTSSDGVIITRTTTFNSDGSIIDTYTSSEGIVLNKKTIFNSDGSVSYIYN